MIANPSVCVGAWGGWGGVGVCVRERERVCIPSLVRFSLFRSPLKC